ncbi:MAG: hypothetical protein WDO13_19145 [Verrucomicrobiota bacterium]
MPNQFLSGSTTGHSGGDLPLPAAASYTTLAQEVIRFESAACSRSTRRATRRRNCSRPRSPPRALLRPAAPHLHRGADRQPRRRARRHRRG